MNALSVLRQPDARHAARFSLLLSMTLGLLVWAPWASADRYTTVHIHSHSPAAPVYRVYHTPVVSSRPAVILQTTTTYIGQPVTHYKSGVKKHWRDGHHPSQRKHLNRHGHPGRGWGSSRNYGKQPVRGSWSDGRQKEIIYVHRDGRRQSSYRDAERTSVIIRQRSR